MKTLIFLILFLGIKNYEGEKTEHEVHITYLHQKDFDEGTYIIDKPGHYILKENIIFDPPQQVPITLMRTNPAYHLGFFAAIAIQSKGVVLDLNGCSIVQSLKHYLHQRFYSHIELGSAPFVPKTGPHDFTNNFVIADNVIIKNGILGLSSHHGIHGNNCEHIKMLDLEIKDFEVGAISINGGKNILVKDVVAGPSSKQVAFLGLFSTGKQIEGYVESLEVGGHICGETPPFITIRGNEMSAREVLENLRKIVKETEDAFLSENYDQIPKLFRNEGNLPDGSALYGILFHSEKPAVGEFNTKYENNHLSSHITLKNVVIKELLHKTREKVSLPKDGETKTEFIGGGQNDPRGSFFNILDYTDTDGGYISNPIGDAQLLVSKYKECLYKNKLEFRKIRLYHTNTKRDSIAESTLTWASKAKGEKLVSNYICNADQMFHAVKGTIPLRLSGVSYVNLKNVKIEKIENTSDFGSKLCGNYRDTTSFANSKPGFLGADLRGITIESCKQVNFKNVNVEDLTSLHGNVIGVESLFHNSGIKGNVNVQNLKTISWKNLPEDFHLIPQSTPFSTPLLISNNSFASLVLNQKKSAKITRDDKKVYHIVHKEHKVEPEPCKVDHNKIHNHKSLKPLHKVHKHEEHSEEEPKHSKEEPKHHEEEPKPVHHHVIKPHHVIEPPHVIEPHHPHIYLTKPVVQPHHHHIIKKKPVVHHHPKVPVYHPKEKAPSHVDGINMNEDAFNMSFDKDEDDMFGAMKNSFSSY